MFQRMESHQPFQTPGFEGIQPLNEAYLGSPEQCGAVGDIRFACQQLKVRALRRSLAEEGAEPGAQFEQPGARRKLRGDQLQALLGDGAVAAPAEEALLAEPWDLGRKQLPIMLGVELIQPRSVKPGAR